MNMGVLAASVRRLKQGKTRETSLGHSEVKSQFFSSCKIEIYLCFRMEVKLETDLACVRPGKQDKVNALFSVLVFRNMINCPKRVQNEIP